MSIIIDGLINTTIVLGILYLLMSITALRKLFLLHKLDANILTTHKLFVMSCLITCVLRFMCFITISTLNFMNFSIKSYGDSGGSKNSVDSGNHDSTQTQIFYDKAVMVLFDCPDFPCISAYILLSVIWAEAFFMSRRHWLSSVYYRRNWIIAYLVFNIILYSTQISLYSLLFLPSVNKSVLSRLIYLTLSTINVVLPLLWMAAYFFLSITFAGFPPASAESQLRLTSLGRLGAMWTLCRLGWGLLDLTTVMDSWMQYAAHFGIIYPIVLVFIFFTTEMLPMAISLYSSSLESIAADAANHGVEDVHSLYSRDMGDFVDEDSMDDLDFVSAHEGHWTIRSSSISKVLSDDMLVSKTPSRRNSLRSRSNSWDSATYMSWKPPKSWMGTFFGF